MNNITYYGRSARRRGQAALIGLLAVVVISILLYMMFLGPRTSPDGESRPSIAKESINRGSETELNSNLGQIRTFISMYRSDSEGKAPESMEELKRASKFPDSMFINPLDGKPLVYDPATGTISAEGARPSAASNASSQNNSDPAAVNPAPAPGSEAAPGMPNVNIPQPAGSEEAAE